MHARDYSCAPILRFFYVASDGATANRQIPDRIFGKFLTILKKDNVPNYQCWEVIEIQVIEIHI